LVRALSDDGRILEQVSGQMKDKLMVVKIDTDKYDQLASQYHIYALPTLVLFKNGAEVDRIEGVLQAAQLIDRVQPSCSTSQLSHA
jgi:thioredoxin-like negative regulator of GroEL